MRINAPSLIELYDGLKRGQATLLVLFDELTGAHTCNLLTEGDDEDLSADTCWACEVSVLSDIDHTLKEIEELLGNDESTDRRDSGGDTCTRKEAPGPEGG